MFALMTFLGTVIAYMLRVNLSVAIVAMVNRTQPITPESSFMSLIQSDDNSSSVCPGNINPINQQVISLIIIILHVMFIFKVKNEVFVFARRANSTGIVRLKDWFWVCFPGDTWLRKYHLELWPNGLVVNTFLALGFC